MSTPVEHTHLGCSGWDGFVRCVGKPNAEAPFQDTAGYPAAEGTVFHELVADCLDFGFEPEDFRGGGLNQDGFYVPYDEDMFRFARDGLDYVRSFMNDPDCIVFIETMVDISPWTLPGQISTADVVIVNVKERWIIVFDWKYGKEPVYAEENYQAQGYCLGSWQSLFGELFDWDPSGIDVTLIIEQPRVPGAGGHWKTTMERTLEFGQHVRRQAVRTQSAIAPRTPGAKQCRWCRARHVCEELAAWHLENLDLDFDDLDAGYGFDLEPTLPDNLTPERRAYLLEIRPMVNQWFDALHKSEYHDAKVGNPTPGRKMVDGRSPARKWDTTAVYKAERVLRRMAKRKAYKPQEMLTPTQAEKVVGFDAYSKHLGRFVDRGSPQPILVSTKDSRPAISSAVDEFDVL
jgi:hypothetical protein